MRCSDVFVFGSPHSTFCLAVRHVSSLKTCLTAQRTLPNRGTVSHLSQLDTCQTPTAELIFATPILQKRRSRSLVHAKTRHNFLTIFYNKVSYRPISLGPLSVDFLTLHFLIEEVLLVITDSYFHFKNENAADTEQFQLATIPFFFLFIVISLFQCLFF